MDCQLHLVIYKRGSVYDNLILKSQNVVKYLKEYSERDEILCDDSLSTYDRTFPVHVNKKGLSSHLVSAYIYNLERSDLYRKSAIQTLILFAKENASSHRNLIFLIKLRNPRKQYIDYAWNEKITQMASEKREIDHAMSWLSTLGGAFSALGDVIPHCAVVAGKISLKQFKLAYRLGDPLLVCRCKLYAALSLIQRGNLQLPKKIIRDTFQIAVKENDIRLQNMCKGIWAKLKYYHDRRKQLKSS